MSDPKTSKNILLLGFVSLLNDISSEIIQPVLPIFIASLGGGSLAVGLIGGISDGLPSLFKVLAGCWSDRLGKRKPLVVAGYALSAVGKLFLPIATTWQQVFLLKTLERSGKGVRSAPRDAMISESTDKSNRGRGFGLHRAMDSTGAVIGSILAYLLWQGGMSYSSIFMVAGVLSLVALLPFYKVLESFRAPNCEVRLKLSGLSPELRRFLVIASLFALGNFSYMFFILRAQGLFSGAEAVAAPLLLYALFNLVYAITGHAHWHLVGPGGKKKGSGPGLRPLCPDRPGICLCLQFSRPDSPLCPLRAGLRTGGRLGEGVCIRPVPRQPARQLSGTILRSDWSCGHYFQPGSRSPLGLVGSRGDIHLRGGSGGAGGCGAA